MDRLIELAALPGLAGHEDAVITYMRDHFARRASPVSVDWMGNVIAEIPPTGGAGASTPKIMVFAHMDELGLLVRKIEPAGFLRVQRLGGMPEKSLLAQRVIVHGRSGPLPAVIGTKSHHLTPQHERTQALTVADLFLDIGARSAEEAIAMGVRVGSPITYAPCFERLGPDLISAKTLDNRAGCWTLLRLLDRLVEQPVPCTVYLVATVQEEFHLQGALPVIKTLQPDLAFCIDIALAADTPDLSAESDIALGRGPVIQTMMFHGRGSLAGLIPNPRLVEYVAAVAEASAIPYQFGVTVGALTDASYAHLGGRGTPALDLGFPARYTHSPIETCSLRDLDALLSLLHALLASLEMLPDLTRGATP
jgi:putative aminopeptidase FrvX